MGLLRLAGGLALEGMQHWLGGNSLKRAKQQQ
jgi:hypothetical protein